MMFGSSAFVISLELIGSGTTSSVMPNDSIRSRSRERPSTDQCSSNRSEGSRLQILLTPNPARARRISSESPCCVPTFINAFRVFAFESPDWRGGVAATCAVTTASVNAPVAIPLPATRTNFRRSISILLLAASHNMVRRLIYGSHYGVLNLKTKVVYSTELRRHRYLSVRHYSYL